MRQTGTAGTVLAQIQRLSAEERLQETELLAAVGEACVGVTPAQTTERLAFLEQAVRAGNRDAMFDYLSEGPNGMDLADVDLSDPNVRAWKDNVHQYMTKLASVGDRRAWLTLSNNYEQGILVAKDYQEAIKYTAALHLNVDPLKANYVAAMVKTLKPEAVQVAIAEGRALAKQFPRQQLADG